MIASVGAKQTISLSALISVIWAGVAQASAWNPAQWHGEVISAQNFLSADQVTNEFGIRSDFERYTKFVSQNYAMLGLTSDIALIGIFDWQDTDIAGPGTLISFSKPSAVSVGLQYQLRRREGHALALSVSYYDGIDLPPQLLTIDSREPTVELRGLWGESRTWHGVNVFAELQLATRLDLDANYAGASSQLTMGGDPIKRVKVIGKLRFTDVAAGTFQNFDLAGQMRWDVEASVIYEFRRRNFIELGVLETFAGQNWVDEGGYKIGFWTQF